MRIEILINGVRRSFEIEGNETLLTLLRREGHVGVKKGCETGDCGACAVLLDGRAVNSCLVLAARADGHEVTTVEGLERNGKLTALQEAFLDAGAVQCGYCTPGMLIAATDLLNHNPDPSEEEIREAISGNLCRCTGYVKQVEGIKLAVKRLKGGEDG